MLPSPGADWEEIMEFALRFDGYEYWGSFEKCAKIANEWSDRFARDGSLPDNLAELRTCLFFEQRRYRHFERAPEGEEMVYIRALVEAIRERSRLL